jgi:hypothetical protein
VRHPHPLPTSRRFPDPQHFANLERLGQEITHETLAYWWTGEQMDYSLAVWGLQSRE